MNSLTDSEKDTLFRLLGPKCKSLSLALAQVWIWDEKGNVRKLSGVLCLVKDYNMQGFYFRLMSLEKNTLLWENLIQRDIAYKVEKSYLHTISLQDNSIALNFADKKEAAHMHKTLCRQVDKLINYIEDFDITKDITEVNDFFKLAGISNSIFREESTRKYIFDLIQMQHYFTTVKKAEHVETHPGTDYYSLPEVAAGRPKTWVDLSFEEEEFEEDHTTITNDMTFNPNNLHLQLDKCSIDSRQNNRLSVDILDLLTPPSTPTEVPKSATLGAVQRKNGSKKSWYRKDKDQQKTKGKHSRISKADIGGPSSFQHVFHSGLDNLNLPAIDFKMVNNEKQTT